MSKPSIAIIGAGPSGLTLARLLHLQNIPFTIFEAEPSPTARAQGGTLDLHPGTGLEAIHKAGLWEQYQQHARFDGDTTTLCDDRLNILMSHVSDGQGDRPEIDRATLRDILLNSIPADTIQWGKKLKSVSPPTLHFADGSSHNADLIVGADGAWSHIRSAVSDEKPAWTGAAYFSLRLAKPSAEITKLVNRGSVFGINNGLCLSIQYMSDDSMQVYAFFQPESEAWIETHGKDIAELDEWYADWHPWLREAFEKADLNFAKNLYMLPVGFRWEHTPGVTLMGDAAHVFTPFAGEGVNCGMTDAMELAEAICSGGFDIKAYEQKKFDRTKNVALLTWQNTVDTLSRTQIKDSVKGFGQRLFTGQPDAKTVLEGKVLSEAMLELQRRNVV